MLWCRFESEGKVSYGIVEGETVVEVEGSPFEQHRVTSKKHSLKAVKLLTPTNPRNFYATGHNYHDHIVKNAERDGITPKFKMRPELGYRSNNALIADGEDIVKPKNSGEKFQYEGELVAVIGKTARRVPREKAREYVFGWTIGNDVSERDWQKGDRSNWRAKNSDTFKPMGPWIATDLEPDDMHTTVRLNDKVVASFDTGKMLYKVEDFISLLTENVTLHPGDVIWLGTDDLPVNMKPGDKLEIEISGIGTLRNNIVAEK